MIKRRMLVVAPYPIERPQHGGQKRIRAIVEYYRTIFTEVRFVAVYHRGFYEDRGEDNILIGQPDIIAQIDKNPWAAEILTGQSIDKDIHVRSPFAEILRTYKPDIIHVEQIFPYAGLGPLLQEMDMHPKLILGSQNIESKMKREIMRDMKVPSSIAAPISKQTQELERRFTQAADLVVAVSEEDAAAHRAMGARRVVVARNGIARTSAPKSSVQKWQRYLKQQGIKTPIVFVGSGHPPNWMGFIDCVGMDSRFLPAGTKILMAGGVSDYFRTTYKPSLKANKNFWAGIEPLGQLSEDDLSGLLEVADMFLLPITSGGGSNLKTAEAILTGKKIVATTFAFRGYEKFLSLPNIYQADTTEAFRNKMLQAATVELQPRSQAQLRLAERVQWKYCLSPIRIQISKILWQDRPRRVVRAARRRAGAIKARLIRR
jgi:glycosyltransferase involved in cell wall biosynthesis